jgi:hypothetical protein
VLDEAHRLKNKVYLCMFSYDLQMIKNWVLAIENLGSFENIQNGTPRPAYRNSSSKLA